MDAARIIAGWKQRLTALADNPEYIYRDTAQHVIEQDYRRLTTFVGYSETEVAAAEARLSVRFSAVFRQYLLEMAKSSGDLFRGSELAGPAEFEQFRANAMELLSETDPVLTLPPDVVVFLFHHGYTFVYLFAVGGFDGPPMQWTETEREPRQVAAGFADMVDAELQLMESNNRVFHERGGYYKTLYPEGGGAINFPSLNSGEQALHQISGQKPWWRFW
jgi:hypothetical protein